MAAPVSAQIQHIRDFSKADQAYLKIRSDPSLLMEERRDRILREVTAVYKKVIQALLDDRSCTREQFTFYLKLASKQGNKVGERLFKQQIDQLDKTNREEKVNASLSPRCYSPETLGFRSNDPLSLEEALQNPIFYNTLHHAFTELRRAMTVAAALEQGSSDSDLDIIHSCWEFSGHTSNRNFLRQAIYEEASHRNLLDRIEATKTRFLSYRSALPEGPDKRCLSWLLFRSLKPLKEKEVYPLPLKLEGLSFVPKKIQKREDATLQWGEFFVCGCGKTSPAGVDLFVSQIAQQLDSFNNLLFIDFGSGGCLSTVALMSRILRPERRKTILLFLIDPINQEEVYCIKKKKIYSFNQDETLPPHILAFLKICLQCMSKESELMVCTFKNSHNAIAQLQVSNSSIVPICLYSIDPVEKEGGDCQGYRQDFATVAQFLRCKSEKDKNLFFYCLNENRKKGDQSQLTPDQACSGDLWD